MKLLAFVDVHGDYFCLRHLASLARKEKVDALVCAGDISNWGQDLDKLVRELDVGVPLFMIPGNHETNQDVRELARKFKFVKNINEDVIQADDIVFFGCGEGGFSSDHPAFALAEKEFRKSTEKLKNRKIVFVTHAPPLGTACDFIYDGHAGVKQFRDFISAHKPVLHICGHLHENEGMKDKIGKTLVVNPGPKGMVLEV
jgi:Icc-related predicted phosphoesterase